MVAAGWWKKVGYWFRLKRYLRLVMVILHATCSALKMQCLILQSPISARLQPLKNKTFQVNQNEKTHVGKFLDLPQTEKSLVGLDECEVCARNEFDWECSTTIGSFKGQDHNVFLSAFGVVLILLPLRGQKMFVLSLVDSFFIDC